MFNRQLKDVFHGSLTSAFHQTAALCAHENRYFFLSQLLNSLIISNISALSTPDPKKLNPSIRTAEKQNPYETGAEGRMLRQAI